MPQQQPRQRTDGCPRWAYLNGGRFGFLRVRYPATALAALAEIAEEQLDSAERVGLLDDLWSQVRHGEAPLEQFLGLAARLHQDSAQPVVDEVSQRLQFIHDQLAHPEDRAAFARWAATMFRPLGDLHVDEVLSGARERLPPALAGHSSLYAALLDRLRRVDAPDETARLLDALPEFHDPRLVRRTLRLALSDQVRSQDLLPLVGRTLEHDPEQAWPFIREHFDAIERKSPRAGYARLIRAAGSFCDERRAREVASFFLDPSRSPRMAAGEIARVAQSIELCAELKRREAPRLSLWLKPWRKETRR